ncbi:Acriflavin resistance protein OS=Rhodanobacter lindaniclasticus OX=75310 GN=B1991_13970 PE=4 SV=1 [Rhodanobacter lindaniclasticus]
MSATASQFISGGGSGDKGGQYEFQLTSTQGTDLQPLAVRKMVRQLRTIKEFRDVSSPFDQVGKQQQLRIDREAAARLHVSVGAIDTARGRAPSASARYRRSTPT